jgi:hypothetical protein
MPATFCRQALKWQVAFHTEVMVLILVVPHAAHPLTAELSLQRHKVLEALTPMEVLGFLEQHPAATIVITAEVDSERAGVLQRNYSVVQLRPQATVKDVLWELNITGGALQ